MANHLHQNDLPEGLDLGPIVAIDCETMGLNPHRDRLCLVQLSAGDETCHLVQFAIDAYDRNLEYGSPDPTDPAVTTRVMTVLLMSEY